MSLSISIPILARSATGFLGLTGTAMGLYCIFDPASASSTFGLPTITNKDAKSSNTSPSAIDVFVSALGGRTLANGLANCIFAYQGNTKALAVGLLCGVVTSAVDATLTFKHGSGDAAFGHAITSGVLVLLGGYFLSLN